MKSVCFGRYIAETDTFLVDMVGEIFGVFFRLERKGWLLFLKYNGKML